MDSPKFSDLFFELRPDVFVVDDSWAGDLDEKSGEYAAGTVRRVRLGAGDTTGVAILDGGVIFHSDEGGRGRLADGVYVVGQQCLRLVLSALGVVPPADPTAGEPAIEVLKELAQRHCVTMDDPKRQAEELADRSVVLDWEGLRTALRPRTPLSDKRSD